MTAAGSVVWHCFRATWALSCTKQRQYNTAEHSSSSSALIQSRKHIIKPTWCVVRFFMFYHVWEKYHTAADLRSTLYVVLGQLLFPLRVALIHADYARGCEKECKWYRGARRASKHHVLLFFIQSSYKCSTLDPSMLRVWPGFGRTCLITDDTD